MTHDLDKLRARIRRIERADRSPRGILPFGISLVDEHLPGGGLALGSLHEVAGGDFGAVHGAAAALFAAGILARIEGPVLWCMRQRDLFAPALAQVGLHPDRVVYVEAREDKAVLQAFEEGLRHGGLAGVVGEISKLSMTASRRLQLAAEESGVLGFALRRWKTRAQADEFGMPTAAVTRWRLSALPSSPLPAPGVGRARWRVELLRCRGAESASWDLEACDETGRLSLPADLGDRSAAPTVGQRRAAS